MCQKCYGVMCGYQSSFTRLAPSGALFPSLSSSPGRFSRVEVRASAVAEATGLAMGGAGVVEVAGAVENARPETVGLIPDSIADVDDEGH